MKTASKFLSIIFAIFFIWAAYVQYNDPDSTQWYLFYGVAAVASIMFFINRFPAILGYILGAIYLGGAIWVWPEKFEGVSIGSGDIENIERGREALGLLIVSAVMFFFGWKARSKKT